MIVLVFKRVLQVAVAALLLLVVLLGFLLASATGTRFLVGTAVDVIDGLTVTEVEGRLIGPLVLRGVRYSSPTLVAEAPEVTLDWQPRSLLEREVKVTRLRVVGARVKVVPPETPPASEPFTGLVLPESLPLPISVALDDVGLTGLVVETEAATLSVGELTLIAQLEQAAGPAASTAPESTASLRWSQLKSHDTQSQTLQFSSSSGELQLGGSPADYALQADVALQPPGRQPITLAIAGEGDQREMRLRQVTGSLLNGELGGNARINWSQGIAAEVALEGTGFDPAQLDDRVPGSLDVSLQANIENDTVALNDFSLTGQLREQPVEVKGALTYADAAAQVKTFAGSIGNTQFSVSGAFADTLDFQWQVNSPDLGAVLPDAKGSLKSQGRLLGSRERPALQGSIALNDARYNGYAAQTVTAKVSVDLSAVNPSSPSTIALRAQGLQSGDTRVTEATVDMRGTLDSHTLTVAAQSEQGSLVAAFAGKWQDDAWSGVWNRGEIQPLALGGWTLQSPHRLELGSQTQKINEACWLAKAVGRSQGGKACFSATRTPADVRIDFTLQQLPLAYFEPLAPEELQMDGQIGASGSVQQVNGGAFALNAAIESSATTLHRADTVADDEVSDAGGDFTQMVQSLALEPGKISVSGTTEELRTVLNLPFSAGGGLSGTVDIQNVGSTSTSSPTSALSGNLEATIPDLSFLSVVSSEIEKLSGAAKVTLSLGGSLQAPKPEGELSVSNLQLSLVTPGILLENATLAATGDTSGNITLRGSAQSDGGSLELKGQGQWVSGSGPESPAIELAYFNAQLNGSDFRFWNTRDAVVRGSPDLTMALADNALRIKGDIVVPHARITPVELPPSAVRPTGDQIIVLPEDDSTTPLEQRVAQTSVFASVRLRLGDDVRIEGFGFKGGLAGDLGITLAPGKPVLASGELNVIGGEYRAFGQGLVVERGQLLFAGGDIENPGLNIRAQRRPAADIVVGVNVTGPLQKPELQIFSEPSMSSSNQLSWLVLGRPFENTSGAETDYIAQAALLLGIQGGDYLAKGFGEKLGLDTVGIETGSGEAGAASDVNQAALVVGKYLTPRLYISYGVGLLESISTVKLRYQISDRWNLVTESSAIASGGDVNFTIER